MIPRARRRPVSPCLIIYPLAPESPRTSTATATPSPSPLSLPEPAPAAAPAPEPEPAPAPAPAPAARRNERFHTASSQRASRRARAEEPSDEIKLESERAVAAERDRLLAAGLTLVAADGTEGRRHRTAGASAAGKGPALRAATTDRAVQARLSHLASLKCRSTMASELAPPWLLGNSTTAPPKFSLLVASQIRVNAVGSSVLERTKTQGAANQTSRINARGISHAAAAQLSAVGVAMAWARMLARRDGLRVANPMATNAVDAAVLFAVEDRGEVFPVISGSQLIFNAAPAKLNGARVLEVARGLAAAELEAFLVSERMGTSPRALESLCRAVVAPSEDELDSVWSAWILIVFLLSHDDGRALLRATPLTDVDFQTASIFESYGRRAAPPPLALVSLLAATLSGGLASQG